jgi:predicted AAA+ superfamily ATPase
MSLLQLSNEQILNRVRIDNPWWTTGNVQPEVLFYPKRMFYNIIYPLIRDIINRRGVVIYGQKRIGKTILIMQSIDQLLKKGVSPHQIVYISFENPFLHTIPFNELFNLVKKILYNSSDEGWYVFFDDIHHVKDWEIQLEKMIDLYSGSKFVAISSFFNFDKDANIGYGRYYEIKIPTFTFYEYLHIQGLQYLILPAETDWKGNVRTLFQSSNIYLLNKSFIHYLNFGGYPELFYNKTIEKIENYTQKSNLIQNLIPFSLLLKNGIQNSDELYKLLYHIALNTGKEFSLEKLAQLIGNIEKITLKKYLKFLENNFLIKITNRLDFNLKKYERANFFKIHINNLSLRNLLIAPLATTDEDINTLSESILFSQYIDKKDFETHYSGWTIGRTLGIVEMLGKKYYNAEQYWASKINWSNYYFNHFDELKSFFNFCENNNINEAIITTTDKSEIKNYNGIEFNFLPLALYAYALGNANFN